MNSTQVNELEQNQPLVAFSPVPEDTQELRDLKQDHPELYKAYVDNVVEGYANNRRVFISVMRAFLISHYSTVVMYWILFFVGVAAVTAAILVGLMGQQTFALSAAFIGVGAASFVAYFIGRSSQSVEENLVYITWLGLIYNSYWTHISWATKQATAQAELDKATNDALTQIKELLERHASSSSKRFKLSG